MTFRRAAYEPMTFGNMREHGMTRLDVSCHGPDCCHRARLEARMGGQSASASTLAWLALHLP